MNKTIDKALREIREWRAGNNPTVTIPNPDISPTNPCTNKLFVRAKANKVWGDPRKQKIWVPREAD